VHEDDSRRVGRDVREGDVDVIVLRPLLPTPTRYNVSEELGPVVSGSEALSIIRILAFDKPVATRWAT